MATLNIQGKRVKVDDSFLQLSPEQQNATVDEIASQMGARDPQAAALADMSKMTTDFQNAPKEDIDRFVRANMEASKIANWQDKGLMRRAADAIPGGATGGFADEIYSGTVGGLARMARDGVGYGEAYKREQALQAALKEKRGTAANVIGDVAGGLALGAKATSGPLTMSGGTVTAARPAWGGATLTGRASSTAGKVAASSGEGAVYGATYGAGNAKEGERLHDAAWGAGTGAVTGGLLEGVGSAISRFISPKTIAPAPGVDELASASNALYEKSRAAGIAIKPQSFDNLANNVAMAAGRPNPNLRPNTAGVVDDVMALRGKPVDLQALDELRQSVRLATKNAQPQDKLMLDRIQKVVDHYSDNVKAGDITGDIKGFEYIKEARKLWAQKSKAQTIEDLLDLADVDTGKYTQSGMANTIRQRMSQLYSQIKKGKATSGWSKDEVALIRQMAKGGSNSQMVNWLSKLSPKGPVSIIANITGGSAAGFAAGPVGLAVGPAMAIGGLVAGKSADKGAVAAANALRDAAARGFVYKAPQLANHLRPAIGGATAGAVNMLPQR